MIQLRPATSSDQPIIKQMIRDAGINPMSLDWHQLARAVAVCFDLSNANDPSTWLRMFAIVLGNHKVISIAVIPERQHQGIASQIIQHLLANVDSAIYLTCRDQRESFYARFGFRKIDHCV